MVFYVNNGRIAGRDHEWVQDSLSVTVAMFRRMGLEMNLEKSKTMVFMPGYIWCKWEEHEYKRQAPGEGATCRERNMLRVSCSECAATVAQYYLKQHMTSLHGLCIPQTRGVDKNGEGPPTYVVSFPWILQSVRCLVPGCPAKAYSVGRLLKHFMFRHSWS